MDKPITEEPCQEGPSITYAVGGSIATVSFQDNETTNRFCPHRYRGGGVRGRQRSLSSEPLEATATSRGHKPGRLQGLRGQGLLHNRDPPGRRGSRRRQEAPEVLPQMLREKVRQVRRLLEDGHPAEGRHPLQPDTVRTLFFRVAQGVAPLRVVGLVRDLRGSLP